MAPQDELVVHEAPLQSPELTQEPFLTQAEGSHFVSRVSELVVLTPSASGMAGVPAKIEQLVSHGLHNIVLSLGRAGAVDDPAAQGLVQAKGYLENWAGTLRICDADPGTRHKLSMLGLEGEGVSLHADRDEAVADYRRSLGAEPLDTGASADLLTSSAEEDWGWGSQDTVEEQPAVEVAELFVEDAELPRLDTQLRRVVQAGKVHVSLRLHFARALGTDDIDTLIGCRDYLARNGGLMVLVALPAAVHRTLQLLGFEQEFAICESGDEAEALHQRHAAGDGAAAAAPPAKPTPPPAKPKPVVAATPAPLPPVTPAPTAPVPARDAAEVEALQARLQQAEQAAEQARRRLSETETAREQALRQAQELQAAARREALAREQAVREAAQAKATLQLAQQDAQRLQGELARAREELTAASRQAANSGDAARRLGELERALQEREETIALLEAQAAQGAAAPGDSNGLAQRVRQLEEEKARILTEAEQEIERLSRERELLREELESAGEMIERLGKELELS